jgi:hypothetical protein
LFTGFISYAHFAPGVNEKIPDFAKKFAILFVQDNLIEGATLGSPLFSD